MFCVSFSVLLFVVYDLSSLSILIFDSDQFMLN